MSKLKILALLTALLAAAFARPALAEEPDALSLTCESFNAPSGTALTGRSIIIRRVSLPFRGQNKGRQGEFRPNPSGIYLAFWNVGTTKNKFDGYFTTLKSRSIKFSEVGFSFWGTRWMSEPESTNYGKLLPGEDLDALRFEADNLMDCGRPAGFSPPAYTERRPFPSWEREGRPEPSLKEFMEKPRTPGEKAPPSVERPPTAPEPRLSELFKPAPPAAGTPGASTPGATPSATPSAPTSPPPTKPEGITEKPPAEAPPPPPPPAKPERVADATPSGVCRADTLAIVPFTEGSVRPNQSYGLRNKKTKAKAYDYVAMTGDAIDLSLDANIASSASRLVSYEPVAFARASNALWVAIPTARLELKEERVRPKAKAKARILIVSGAKELVISGLDAVAAELAKATDVDVRPDIIWYPIESNGALKPASTYSSFDSLLAAAAARATDERLDVLDEAALLALIDDLQKTISNLPTPVDRVVWFKGSYEVPSSFPKRFEEFISQAGESPGIAKLPGGRIGKWLTVVTARMPGFSIAYLKEPITKLQAGDVLDEEGVLPGAKRRMIQDPRLFAIRLRTGLKTQATEEPASATNPAKLVQNADEVFDERGHLVPISTLAAYRLHLAALEAIWSEGANLNPAAVSELARKLNLAEPVNLPDLIQGGRPGTYPPLPRWISEALRRPLSTLTPKEREEAREIVRRQVEAVTRLVELSDTAKATRCAHLFVSEQALGFRR